VQAKIRITDADVQTWLESASGGVSSGPEYNLAQVFLSVPENASAAVLQDKRAQATTLLEKIRAGESFETIAQAYSEDLNKAQGGVIGLRSKAQLPAPFIEAVSALSTGEVASAVVRSSAGFHLLKLLEKRQTGAAVVSQSRVRHILLRLNTKDNSSPDVKKDQAVVLRRMQELKQKIERGAQTFEQVARELSEDASAAQGGDLGWSSAGAFVPEFEQAMNTLPLKTVSAPVITRFGVHLLEVVQRREQTLDAKAQRERAMAALREQKFEAAAAQWLSELRSRAYIELRDAP
jgi:peptidyl-prolyl cis-trans isomerase SurA